MNSVVDSGVPRRNFDVIVVGGGVVGLSVAYYLSERRGVKVAVIERGRFGRGATWAAAGMLAPQCEVEQPGPFLTFALAGRALYKRLADVLRAETGVDIGLRECGALRVALTEQQADALKPRSATTTKLVAQSPVARRKRGALVRASAGSHGAGRGVPS